MQTENAIRINDNDNVIVALRNITAGEDVAGVTAAENIDRGHKMALVDIKEGENVVKYGYPIGHATKDIKKGEWIHTHNLKTNLKGLLEYTYEPELNPLPTDKKATFMGYNRKDGSVGIRNEIWIVNTVGCVNKVSERIAKLANEKFAGRTDGIFNFVHPFGCSQLSDDHVNTQKLLAGMVNHPNAAGVLVLSLGCENNNVAEFKKVLGDYDEERVKFLICQDYEDEVEEALKLIEELVGYAEGFKQEEIDASKLVIGLKCGGSDGFSGITANPLVGRISDILVQHNGTTVLSEVPEMFGAETILMNRCETPELFNQTVDLINNFKAYFMRYNQEVYENPSPGNKKGGISTLEDKSLGCTQKGGTSNVKAVLDYAEKATVHGLNLLRGPGNDIVAITGLMASGCHIILFTTGRGTPVGAPVPTVKVATNSELANKKKEWIDFNAGQLLEGKTMDQLSQEFFDYILKVASKEIRTKNEIHDYREISIFKDGVTL